MKRYLDIYLAVGLIITLMSMPPLFEGVSTLNPGQILFFGVFPILWWLAYHGLKRSERLSLPFSCVVAAIPPAGILLLTIRDRIAVMRNKGIELVDASDCPMAFLIGRVFEAAVFLLFAFVVWQGVSVLLENKRQRRAADTIEDTAQS